LLAAALDSLFRRFCRGLERPLLAMALLSPGLLPGFNLMLDVPALALALAAVALFLSACDRGSPGRAALAGLLARPGGRAQGAGRGSPSTPGWSRRPPSCWRPRRGAGRPWGC